MDFRIINKNNIFNLLSILSIIWGVYEFKKFNSNLKEIIKLVVKQFQRY